MKYIKKHKDLLIVGIILITYIFLWLNISYVGELFNKVISLLTPFIYGFIVAYLLNPLVKFLENNKLFNKIKKNETKHILGITIAYLIFIVLFLFSIIFIIPEIWQSINNIFKDYPNIIKTTTDWITNKIPQNLDFTKIIENNIKDWTTTLLNNTPDMATKAIDITKSITKTIINIFIGLIISLYMLMQKETFIRQSKKVLFTCLKEDKAQKTLDICTQLNNKVSKFLVAKIIDSIIIGIMCYVGVLFLKVNNSLTIAFIVGATNIIPYFGPFIGAIPCIIMILSQSPMKALIFSIFILILQQFDGNILGPKLMGNSLGLSAFWIIFAVVMMTGLLGFTGMLIGVPIFAVIYTLIQEKINDKQKNS